MALMYRKVLSVITQPPSSRSDSMIEQLFPWFQKKSELFKSLQRDVMKDIIRNCEFITCHRDDVIIQQSDTGNRFYIILGGQISIYINNKIEEDEASGSVESGRLRKKTAAEVPGYKAIDRSVYGAFVTTLGEGKSFGEVALITEDCVRTATVIADTKTDLLVVSRELFNRCLRAAQEQEFNAKMAFANTCEYFCNWRPKYKKQVAMSLIRRKAAFDEKIVKQGSSVEGIFFVIKGQVKITMDPSSHWRQNSAVWQVDSCFWTKVMRPDFRSKLCGMESAKVEEQERSRRDVEVCIAAPLEAIGEVEVSLDIPTYLQTATAIEPCELLLLTKRAYDRLVLKKYTKTADALIAQSRNKIGRRLERFSKNDNPYFLRCLWLKLHIDDQKSPQDGSSTSESKLSFINTTKELGAKASGASFSIGKTQADHWQTFSPAKQQASQSAIWTTFNKKMGGEGRGATGLTSICEEAKYSRREQTKITRRKPLSGQREALKRTETLATILPINEKAKLEGAANEKVGANFQPASPLSPKEEMVRSATVTGLSELDRWIYSPRGEEKQTKYKEECTDWETSDEALSMLESRLKTWLSELESTDKKPKRVFRLRRFSSDNAAPPLPGQKVIMSPRRNKSDTEWTVGSDEDDDKTLAYSDSPVESMEDYSLLRYKPRRASRLSMSSDGADGSDAY
ncbi:uncharacterized protein LOC106173901 [Lingula anatina]|uniref:Uncharacterized protein LOC106173901 n=1 Tax=Lingula anatina TaxID=7574 RepID=A0A1S3JJU5_LINAN|nr:uncharacterized protein LOC106173901 [Lingula anatina]XP_013410685.1 uncharacterized protein LOC106173901 [Lingula anatina]XP_013410686.1 uncharacterized protein LOC106173901 [Lingula anatina]|eukprot:XP_013410684.1 uncharacterized protein LOC106173901 [Lingula anatina]